MCQSCVMSSLLHLELTPPIPIVLCLFGIERSGGRRGGQKKKGVAFARLESNLSVFNGCPIIIAIESYLNVGHGRPVRPLCLACD